MKGAQGLAKFAADLRRLPKVLAQRITTAAAPAITALAESSFRASADPYGTAWQPSSDGKTVTLQRTGALFRFLRYVAVGTKLRVALGVPYAKYQIGKRPIFPRQGAPLPASYVAALEQSTKDAASEVLNGR